MTCAADDKVTARLKPSSRLEKALRKARKPVTATVKITMGTGTAATSSSQKLVLTPRTRR